MKRAGAGETRLIGARAKLRGFSVKRTGSIETRLIGANAKLSCVSMKRAGPVEIGLIRANAKLGGVSMEGAGAVKIGLIRANAKLRSVSMKRAGSVETGLIGSNAKLRGVSVKRSSAVEIGLIGARPKLRSVSMKRAGSVETRLIGANANLRSVSVERASAVKIGLIRANAKLRSVSVKRAGSVETRLIGANTKLRGVSVKRSSAVEVGLIRANAKLRSFGVKRPGTGEICLVRATAQLRAVSQDGPVTESLVKPTRTRLQSNRVHPTVGPVGPVEDHIRIEDLMSRLDVTSVNRPLSVRRVHRRPVGGLSGLKRLHPSTAPRISDSKLSGKRVLTRLKGLNPQTPGRRRSEQHRVNGRNASRYRAVLAELAAVSVEQATRISVRGGIHKTSVNVIAPGLEALEPHLALNVRGGERRRCSHLTCVTIADLYIVENPHADGVLGNAVKRVDAIGGRGRNAHTHDGATRSVSIHRRIGPACVDIARHHEIAEHASGMRHIRRVGTCRRTNHLKAGVDLAIRIGVGTHDERCIEETESAHVERSLHAVRARDTNVGPIQDVAKRRLAPERVDRKPTGR